MGRYFEEGRGVRGRGGGGEWKITLQSVPPKIYHGVKLPLDKLQSGRFSLNHYCNLQSVMKTTLVELATRNLFVRWTFSTSRGALC